MRAAVWKPGIVERPRRAHVDGAADAAFERRGLRGLVDIGARDDVGRQHVEGERPPVVIGRQDAVVQGHDVVLRAEAAYADVLPFTAGGAR